MVFILKKDGNEWKQEPQIKNDEVVETVVIIHELGVDYAHEFVKMSFFLQ